MISGLFFISVIAAIGRPQFATGPQKCYTKTQDKKHNKLISLDMIANIYFNEIFDHYNYSSDACVYCEDTKKIQTSVLSKNSL